MKAIDTTRGCSLTVARAVQNVMMQRGTRLLVSAVVISASLVGCARPGADNATSVTLATTNVLPTSTSTATTPAPVETVQSTTPGPATTIVPTITEPPTTTEAPAIANLILRSDGIGAELFGADPDAVVSDVTALLGGNTADTGWVESQTLGACPGTKVRRVEWGVLKLWFADTSDFAADRDHFFAWEYGQVSELGGDPAGLHTSGGVTIGSQVEVLQAEFPDAVVRPADEEFDAPSTAYVSDTLYAWLTGANANDSVLVLFGGRPCGNS